MRAFAHHQEVVRRRFVAANWKMHGRLAVFDRYIEALGGVPIFEAAPEVVICPPASYLHHVAERLSRLEGVTLGAQDCSVEEADGAFTGEISAAMLVDVGCKWVIVGHSERRHRFGESSETVAAKFRAARRAELSPILCVGETRSEREAGRAGDVIRSQLRAVVDLVGTQAMEGAVIAYEPVWAIGSGEPATPREAGEMHELLRDALGMRAPALAESLRIVYGGSVSGENAAQFLSEPSVDGALVGGAALEAEGFLKIVRAAAA